MNSFLHPLDIELDAMIEQKNGEFDKIVHFARYADDILVGIPSIGVGVMSLSCFLKFNATLDHISSTLRFCFTHIGLKRWRAPVEPVGPKN